ncbi:MAG TPA: FAD-binding protein [Gaiellaceae bacterium]|nr:FAD-binding protein [Gaiellaceae bacterium]
MIDVAGGGMAGLVAAARLRELGQAAVVREKGARLGGSMLLSSCVIWRYRTWEDVRRECPGGDEMLQRLVYERLDDALDWLRSIGAPVVWEETGNPLTVGQRFDPRGLTEVLAARCGEIVLGAAGFRDEPTILCTGGFGASSELVTRYIAPAASLRLRANPWSTGDGLATALDRGGALSGGMDEFYGRNMPDAAWDESEFVSASQLYGQYARIFDLDGTEFFQAGDVSWSETNVVQATARRPGARAFYLLDDETLSRRLRDRTVADLVAAAPSEARVAPADLPFDPPPATLESVRVIASITHTVGGLRVDQQARVVRPDATPIDGLWAAGVDVGGLATGGYASGLAQALVLGLVAAENA